MYLNDTRINYISRRAGMATSVKVLTPIKPCSTRTSHDQCSTVVTNVGSNPTPSIVFNMLRVITSRDRFNYIFT